VCGVALAPGGDASVQLPQDCKRIVCDGAGHLSEVDDDTDVPVDGKECTADVCTAGVPSNPPLPSGTLCTAGYVCDGAGNCVGCIDDTTCDDGTYCNGAEQCIGGICVAGTPIVCASDGLSCTTELCDESTTSCKTLYDDAGCQDAVFCNGQETCDPAKAPSGSTTGCAPGTPVVCDDAVGCTADQCDESAKGCSHQPNDVVCDDGLFCTLDVCDPTASGSGCKHPPRICPDADGIACTEESCSESTDTCDSTPNNAACASGQLCVAGVGCATVSCTQDADCSDGNPCNGVETCAGGACQPGTPPSCDDGVACTVDICDPSTGTCSHVPSDALCSDGQLCNGIEKCSATLGCQSAAPFVCPPTVPCVTMVCDPVLNSCKAVPDDSACPCGQSCDIHLGCGDYCKVRTCEGKVYACGDCLDNDGDCTIDANDAHCTGPCDDSEANFTTLTLGDPPKCRRDCYFDSDFFSANDDCYWDARCDPLEPEADQGCSYDPSLKLPGSKTCGDYATTQSIECHSYCRDALTPNGCDCFGCCAVPIPNASGTITVYLGTDAPPVGLGHCDLSSLTDPTTCAPCTQVPSCLNPCEGCEKCVGVAQSPVCEPNCQPGLQACGLPGLAPCFPGYTCWYGCCQPIVP